MVMMGEKSLDKQPEKLFPQRQMCLQVPLQLKQQLCSELGLLWLKGWAAPVRLLGTAMSDALAGFLSCGSRSVTLGTFCFRTRRTARPAIPTLCPTPWRPPCPRSPASPMPMAPTRTRTSPFHGPLEPGSVVQVSPVTDPLKQVAKEWFF